MRTRGYEAEFPELKRQGLYAADIKGDGNCLFNALSDQIYGNQDRASEIRARIVSRLRANEAHFKPFLDARLGGGGRSRVPKRKCTPCANVPIGHATTSQQMDNAFDKYCTAMSRNGEYGGDLEITAFTAEYDYHVKVYKAGQVLEIKAGDLSGQARAEVNGTVHIAHHLWEHFSSIRNIEGPHTGLPEIVERSLTPEKLAKNKAAEAIAARCTPAQVKILMQKLDYPVDQTLAKNTLVEFKGDLDRAYESLRDAEDTASVSSQTGSVSTERDHDSEDEDHGISKKQDRKPARPMKKAVKSSATKLTRASSPASAKKNSPAVASARVTRSKNAATKAGTHIDSKNGTLTPPDTDEENGGGAAKSVDSAEPDRKVSRVVITNKAKEARDKAAQKAAEKASRMPRRDVEAQKKKAQKAAKKERVQEARPTRKGTPSTQLGEELRGLGLRSGSEEQTTGYNTINI